MQWEHFAAEQLKFQNTVKFKRRSADDKSRFKVSLKKQKKWGKFQNLIVERDNVPFVRLNRGSRQRMDKAQAERRGERAHQTCPRCNHCGKQIKLFDSQHLIKGTADNGSVRKEKDSNLSRPSKMRVLATLTVGRMRPQTWRVEVLTFSLGLRERITIWEEIFNKSRFHRISSFTPLLSRLSSRAFPLQCEIRSFCDFRTQNNPSVLMI